jgi:hypothetical protein
MAKRPRSRALRNPDLAPIGSYIDRRYKVLRYENGNYILQDMFAASRGEGQHLYRRAIDSVSTWSDTHDYEPAKLAETYNRREKAVPGVKPWSWDNPKSPRKPRKPKAEPDFSKKFFKEIKAESGRREFRRPVKMAPAATVELARKAAHACRDLLEISIESAPIDHGVVDLEAWGIRGRGSIITDDPGWYAWLIAALARGVVRNPDNDLFAEELSNMTLRQIAAMADTDPGFYDT